MIKKVILVIFISGCASSLPGVDFYHRLSTKPEIVEQVISSEERKITVSNPFDVSIEAIIDCDEDIDRRKILIKPNSSSSFITNEPTELLGRVCAMDEWKVK